MFIATCCTLRNPTVNLIPNGCSKDVEWKDGQIAATEIIWRSFGNSNVGFTPIVEWYEGAKLDCPGHTSFWGVSAAGTGRITRSCLLGVYIRASHLAIVAYQPGQRMSDTALAHELCHAYFRDTEEVPHSICKDDGSIGDPVTKANFQLKMMGM